jgi:3-oxoacyl-[acyl-carrier protein] reductase
MGKLDGKVAVVTGSTSGMGRETAYLFAKEGAKVVVTGRNEERAKAVVDKIKADGGEAIYVIADTSDLDQVDRIYDATMKAYGTVDILMNNNGRLSLNPIQKMTLEEWTAVFNVNVTSAMLLTQKFEPELKKNHGHVVNIASVAGCASHWGAIAYTTSKHAMVGMTKSMARELGPEVHVNGICPGAIRTAMLDSVGGEEAASGMKDMSPLHRIGDGSDIANVALFLATDDSSFIDGQLIRVDGGVDC